MTRYERTQETIQKVERSVPHEDVRDFLLVADLTDHLDESSAVHVDAARAALDWFCARYPDHPVCLASASRRNTRRAWEAFGYVHLQKEYPSLRLLDLNKESLPQASFMMHLTKQTSTPWGAYLVQPRRYYTPRGHIWDRVAVDVSVQPHLTIVVQ